MVFRGCPKEEEWRWNQKGFTPPLFSDSIIWKAVIVFQSIHWNGDRCKWVMFVFSNPEVEYAITTHICLRFQGNVVLRPSFYLIQYYLLWEEEVCTSGASIIVCTCAPILSTTWAPLHNIIINFGRNNQPWWLNLNYRHIMCDNSNVQKGASRSCDSISNQHVLRARVHKTSTWHDEVTLESL